MSKQDIASSLEDIQKKLNMLVKKQCGKRNTSGSDEEREARPLESGEQVKPKHTRSPYVLFCMDERVKLIKRKPNLSFCEVSKELANMWKELPESKKKKYQKMSEEDKLRYANEKS